MKPKKYLLTALALSLLLTSCAETPDGVKENTDENAGLSDAASSYDEDTFETVSLSKMSGVMSVTDGYDNLTIDEPLYYSVPDEIGVYQVEVIDNNENDYINAAFEKYIPSNIDYTDKIVCSADEGIEWTGPIDYFYEDDAGLMVILKCDGYFCYRCEHSEMAEDLVFSMDAQKDVYYVPQVSEDITVSYADGECRLIDEIETSESVMADFDDSLNEYDARLIAQVAEIFHADDGTDVLEVQYSLEYKGLPIFYMLSTYEELSFNDSSTAVARLGLTRSESEGKVFEFYRETLFEDYKEKETYDSVISAENAVKLMSNKLSQYAKYNVVGMELVYSPTYVDNIEEPTDGLMTHKEAAAWANYCSYDIIELTPYWAIYFDVTPQEEIYGLVNCLTGEVEFVNNSLK